MITVEQVPDAAIVRLDDGGLNTLDVASLRQAASAMGDLVDAPAVVLTGAGKVFSAGLDLRRLVAGGAPYIAELLPALNDAFLAVFDHPRPVVAAVNGHALAGGCVLAAACDVRIMSAGTIGLTELAVGVPFPAAVLGIVRYAFGAAASELALSGRALTPPAALTAGLVHEVSDPGELLQVALHRARAMARTPAAAYAMTKEQLHRDARGAIDRSRATDDPATLAMWTEPATLASAARFLDDLAQRRRR